MKTETQKTEDGRSLAVDAGSADQYMEEICDKIRRGEPVGFMDALAAIEYQRQRKLQGPPPFWKRVIRFFLPNDELRDRSGSGTQPQSQPSKLP